MTNFGINNFLKSFNPESKPSSNCYQVGKGDNLSTIAKKFGVSLKDIMKANPGIKDANKIQIGQRIIIPTTNKPASSHTQVQTNHSAPPQSIFNQVMGNNNTSVEGLNGHIVKNPNNLTEMDSDAIRYLMTQKHQFD